MGHKKVKWGVLSTAAIGVRKVIPAMQLGDWSDIVAIASRDGKKAESVARKLRIPKTYWSYEELLADPEIEAVYKHMQALGVDTCFARSQSVSPLTKPNCSSMHATAPM